MTIKKIFILLLLMGTWACTHNSVKTEKMAVGDIPLNTGVKDASFLSDMEKEIIVELNTARSDPKRYADFLKSLKGRAQWEKGLEEAILFVEKAEPLPVLRVSKGLSLSAKALVSDRGPGGLTGHVVRDGRSMVDRMNSFGQQGGRVGEYLGYGYSEGAALVARLAIDEGAEGTKDKGYLFDSAFLVVGVACGPHKANRIMCAIDFAHSFKENPDVP